MDEPEDKGYTVSDKRYLHLSEEEKAKVREAEAAARRKAEAPASQAAPEAPLPEITFSSFIISLSSSAFIYLGEMPDPTTGQTAKNLPLAKQTIDLLGLLREKTRGNLLEEEERLFEHLLYDLRMRYVKVAG